MDPFSVTASIITLIQAANKVYNICTSYKAALTKDSPARRVLDGIKDLRIVLERLQEITEHEEEGGTDVEEAGISDKSFGLRKLQVTALPDCLAKLEELEVHLQVPKWASGRDRRLQKALHVASKSGLVSFSSSAFQTHSRLRVGSVFVGDSALCEMRDTWFFGYNWHADAMPDAIH